MGRGAPRWAGVVMGGRLLVVRDRAHAREAEATAELGATDAVWTLAELFDRLGDWGLGPGHGSEPRERDDEAALFATASALAEGGPERARLAGEARSLAIAFAHGRTSAAEVAGALQARGSAAEAGSELAWLLARLQVADQRLAQAGVVDGATALGRAVERLEGGERPPALCAFDQVQVRGLVDPTDLEVRALLGLARAGLPLSAQLPVDSAGRGLLSGVQPVLSSFEAAHEVAGLDLDLVDVAEADPPGSPLAAFLGAWYAADGATAADAPVEARVLADEPSEAREVARVVAGWRDAARAAGERVRVAVALRTVGDDGGAARLADALLRHGIAAEIRRRPLVETVAARLVLDWIALALHGAPRDRLLAVLSSPVRKGALPAEEVARVHRALRLAAARTDVEDAARPTGGYRHRLERFAAAADDTGPRDAARDALEHLAPVLARAAALPRQAPMAAHLEAICALAEAGLAPGAHRACAEVLAVLGRARDAARRVARPEDPSLSLASAARLVEGALRAAQASEDDAPPTEPLRGAPREEAPAKDGDDAQEPKLQVEILSLPELWGRHFEHVVVAGCVEGRLPRTERAERLLSDTERGLVNAALGRPALRLFDDDPLEASPVPRTQALEPVWMLGALRAASCSLLLTAARRDARGRETAPSVFLLEALRALGAGPHELGAGTRFARALSVGERGIELARARAVGTPVEPGAARDEAPGAAADLPAALLARIDHARRVRDERARFFAAPAGTSPLEVAAPHAYAVSPARVARAFGGSFGLSAERPLTPTRLETLAGCRFKGLFKEVLKLDVELPAGNAADQRVIGTLAHAVMERFYGERRRAGVPAARVTAADRRRVRQLVAEEAAPLLAGRATGHLGAIRAQIGWLETALVRAVSMLARRPPVDDVEPVELELQVGVGSPRGPADWSAVPMKVSSPQGGPRTLWLGGIIDRVDEGPGGRAVIDYKTSRSSKLQRKVKADALFTKHFQLLLYLRVLEHHRPTAPGTPLHGYLVSLLDGTASADVARAPELRERLLDDEHPEGLAAGIARVIGPVLDGVAPPDASDDCAGCRLRRACRLPLHAARSEGEA